MKKLPINDVIPKIRETLENNMRLILDAPAGAGKSTMVPISLLDEKWLKNRIIIMLEPRRVAARTVALQMAKLLGEKVGQRVGYQVKMDSCFSNDTKILVVTEGILTRKLQSDQALENVALIIFDEFHERSIHTDLSLALSLQSQELLRDDLRILLMSATLNTNKIATLLDNTVVIKSEGRMFDVEDIYLKHDVKHPSIETLSDILLKTILKCIEEDDGDILVFLAGMKEIRNLSEKLNYKLSNSNIEVLPLHSNLTREEQDKAIFKGQERKIILSTNIAQTSLTIEGIKVVIDSGLEKQIRFNPSTDMNHLEYTFISKESATQRSGRAGRLSSGKCYKLWHKNRILNESSKPEILRADLSSLLLDVALWGIKDLNELKFLDIPNSDTINSSKQLLQDINMLDEKGNITKYGKQCLSLGIHPRFANMIFKANDLGLAYEGCLLACLLAENDIFKNTFSSCDIYERYVILKEKSFNSQFINIFRAKQILTQTTYLYKKLQKTIHIKNVNNAENKNKELEKNLLGVLLLYAYPNRLAKQREKNDNKYKLSNEKGAILNNKDTLFNTEYLVVPNINAKELNSHIIHACSISFEYIKKYFSSYLKEVDTVIYKKEKNILDIKTSTCFFKLELFSSPNLKIKKEKYPRLLIDLIKKEGLELLSWSKKSEDLISKVCFANYHKKDGKDIGIELPDFTQEGLINNLDKLEVFLQNISSLKALKEIDTYSFLSSLISWKDLKTLENVLPDTIKVPSGSNIKIDYTNIETPILKVKIQEVFGLKQTPKILNNSLALQIHLLTPAQRPIQITYDLVSFWANSYTEVRKELRGKYKRHYWPENPYEAIATSKTKKKM